MKSSLMKIAKIGLGVFVAFILLALFVALISPSDSTHKTTNNVANSP